MVPILLSIPGKLKILIDRITAARMTKIDEITPTRMGYLDASINSRAPSSTALSSATWTSARASALDEITATRMSKIDSLRTVVTDSRASNLDQISSTRMAKIDALDARLSDARVSVLDTLGSGVPTVRQIATGVVRTLTDTGPAYSFSRTEQSGSPQYGYTWYHFYNFTQKQERWIADISVPEIVNIDKALIFLQGSAKCDDLTYFRRPVCAKVLDTTTIRIYVDDTRANEEGSLYVGSLQIAPVPPVPNELARIWSLANPGGPSSLVSPQINGHDIRWTMMEYL